MQTRRRRKHAVKCEEYDDVCVIGVTGELAGDSAARRSGELRKTRAVIETEQIVDFVVDLEKAGFIDSEGLETCSG